MNEREERLKRFIIALSTLYLHDTGQGRGLALSREEAAQQLSEAYRDLEANGQIIPQGYSLGLHIPKVDP